MQCFSLGFFKIFSLSLPFSVLYYDVSICDLFAFILGACRVSWMCRLLFFNKFGKLLPFFKKFLFFLSSPGTLSSRAAKITELVICSYVNKPQAALLFRFLCLLSNFLCCPFTVLTVTTCYCELVFSALTCCFCVSIQMI